MACDSGLKRGRGNADRKYFQAHSILLSSHNQLWHFEKVKNHEARALTFLPLLIAHSTDF
jgi:hypothetical protein